MTTLSETPAPADARRRFPRLDPLLGLSCLLALLVYLPHGFDGTLTRDLAVYAYGGQQFADGVAPYVAILNRAGPLAHLIPGVGAWVSQQVGVDDLLGMRVLLMLFAVASVGASYLLGRDAFRSRLAGLAAAAAMLCFKGFIIYATYGPREKTSMVFFVLVALLAMVHQRWATTGVFIALATLTWQPVFFAAIAGAVVAVLLGVRQGRIRALLRLAVGGLVPLAAFVVYYAVIGELKVFVDDFLIINARYTEQVSLVSSPGHILQGMQELYGWTLWVFVVGSLAQLAIAAYVLRGPARREPLQAAQIGMGVLFLVGVVWSLKAFNGWPDCFFMFPGAAVGIGGLAAAVARRLPLRVALLATSGWLVVATALSLVYSVDTRDDTLVEQRAGVDTVMGILPAGANIFSVEAPQPLVLTHQRNLSRLQLFGNGLEDYLQDTWPGGQAGYSQWIVEQHPTVIAVGTESDVPPWLPPALDQGDYRDVGGTHGWRWWVSSDVGKPTLDRLRTALHG